MLIQTYDEGKNSLVTCGEIRDKTYYRTVDSSKHYLHMIGGYGIQKSVLYDLIDKGIKQIEIYETDTKQTYTVSIAEWQKKGVPLNLNHGMQIFLPTKKMHNTQQLLMAI